MGQVGIMNDGDKIFYNEERDQFEVVHMYAGIET
jgi:hypothetical protein